MSEKEVNEENHPMQKMFRKSEGQRKDGKVISPLAGQGRVSQG